MPKITIDEEKCKGCTLCILTCPKKLIVMSDKLNKKGYHPAEFSGGEDCTGCGFCFLVCPDVVIEVYR